MRTLFFIISISIISFTVLGDNGNTSPINLQHTHGGDHYNYPTPADEPDAYYAIDTQEIIIDGLGVVNYYDVEIVSATSLLTVLTTQVNGYYDTIDISSLVQGAYYIIINTPLGNTYEGYFDTYDD